MSNARPCTSAGEAGNAQALKRHITVVDSILYRVSVFWFANGLSKARGSISTTELHFPQRFPQRVGSETWKKKGPRRTCKWIKTEVLRGFTRQLPGQDTSAGSDGARTAQEPDREHEESADKPENAVNRDSDQPERQRKKPDDGIQNKSNQCD